MARPNAIDEFETALGDLSPLLSLDDASRATGLSTTTLKRRIASGELRAIKTHPGHGGRIRILRRDLAALLARMCETHAGEKRQ